MPVFESTDEMIAGERVLIDQGYIQPGTEVVVLAGNSPMRGATNLMKVEVFGDAYSTESAGDERPESARCPSSGVRRTR